jgi:hypothetical protein
MLALEHCNRPAAIRANDPGTHSRKNMAAALRARHEYSVRPVNQIEMK